MPDNENNGGNGAGHNGRADPPPPKALDFTNRNEVRAWLHDLREQVLDATAAGEDATRRPKKRVFSRAEARRRIREAEKNLLALLEAAERGLS